MWWLISVLYALVGLLVFRSEFRSVLKAMDRTYNQDYEHRSKEHNSYCNRCGRKECTRADHAPRRARLSSNDRLGATLWGLLNGLFWLPIFLGKTFWKGLFPKGVLAETSKERKQRLKKEAEAEAEALLKKAKEMGLM